MECAIVPVVLILLAFLCWHFQQGREWTGLGEWLDALMIVFGILATVALVVWPVAWLSCREDIIEAEAYWETFVQPNIVAIEDDRVVVDNTNAAVWQAGASNLPAYNEYLASARYWDAVPVLGWYVWTPSEDLKPAVVRQEARRDG